MPSDSEFQLVALSKQGDHKAYEQLYRANAGKVYALCMRLCGQRELAEDLTQEAFIRAWQKIGSFRGDSAFGSWLYRLTSNLVIGHLRQQTKWKMDVFNDQKHEATLGFASIDDQRSDIEQALMALPDQARVVVILYEYLGYKHNEISALTGMAVGTSKSQLHRARAILNQRATA
ncbi:MAG: RNA polymerase sigma factor [Gammaproteobacteria bacterium]|nr:RNA polymerase sigma factor [Gammaproteobacteria bacterium]